MPNIVSTLRGLIGRQQGEVAYVRMALIDVTCASNRPVSQVDVLTVLPELLAEGEVTYVRRALIPATCVSNHKLTWSL